MTRQMKTAAAALLALALPATAMAEDAVAEMCMERDTAEVCACAAEALLGEIGDEDYAIYEAIAADYLARMAAGEGRVDAWMAASRTEADNRGLGAVELMGRSNEIGEVYRASIKDCGG